MIGPVQVLVLGFDEPVFQGEILKELARLDDAGIVRLLDVVLVSRLPDGSFQTLAPPAGMPPDAGELAAALLGGAEGQPAGQQERVPADATAPAPGSAWSLEDAVPAGSSAAVALVEHTWAAPLREVIQRAGGTALDETWLSPADLQSLDELMQLRRS